MQLDSGLEGGGKLYIKWNGMELNGNSIHFSGNIFGDG